MRITKKIIRLGFYQSLSLAIYCTAIGTFFWNADKIFGKKPSHFAPVAFLTLFLFSALTCGLIVFYNPYRMFFEGKKKDAADLVLATAGWLFMFVLVFLMVVILRVI